MASTLYIVKNSGHAEIDGKPVIFYKGQFMKAGDPLTKIQGFIEAFLEPVGDAAQHDVRQATADPDAGVESATAAPGEKRRAPRRSRKAKAAPKAAKVAKPATEPEPVPKAVKVPAHVTEPSHGLTTPGFTSPYEKRY